MARHQASSASNHGSWPAAYAAQTSSVSATMSAARPAVHAASACSSATGSIRCGSAVLRAMACSSASSLRRRIAAPDCGQTGDQHACDPADQGQLRVAQDCSSASRTAAAVWPCSSSTPASQACMYSDHESRSRSAQ